MQSSVPLYSETRYFKGSNNFSLYFSKEENHALESPVQLITAVWFGAENAGYT